MERAILGVSPGKVTGIVLMRGGRIDHWRLHTGNAAALATTFTLIREYDATHMALHRIHAQARFPGQEQLVYELKRLAEVQGLTLSIHSTHELRRHIPGGHVNKASLFRFLSQEYPELSRPYHKYLHQSNRYWNRLFEAAACAYFITL